MNPRIFGSRGTGRGDGDRDLDALVDLLSGYRGSRLLRVSGIAAGLEAILGCDVDVVAPDLLRESVSSFALEDAVAL